MITSPASARARKARGSNPSLGGGIRGDLIMRCSVTRREHNTPSHRLKAAHGPLVTEHSPVMYAIRLKSQPRLYKIFVPRLSCSCQNAKALRPLDKSLGDRRWIGNASQKRV